MKIGTKLPLVMTSVVAVAVVIMSFVSAQSTKNLIRDGAIEKVRSAAALKAESVEVYLQAVDRDLELHAASPVTIAALSELARAFTSMKNAEEVLRRVFITDNANAPGQKDHLIKADTGSSYGFYHEDFHLYFDNLQNEMNYYDVLLFDPAGNLVYSVIKENDFATNMITGPWKASGLSYAFRQAVGMGADDPSVFIDFLPYEPSGFVPAAFVARPVFEEGKLLGVLAYQLPVDQFNRVARMLTGLGKTANGFVVGSDRLMRTDSILTEQNDSLSVPYDNAAVSHGLAGGTGAQVGVGQLGQDVVEAYMPILFDRLEWVIFVQQDQAEIFQNLNAAVIEDLMIAAAVFAGVFGVSDLFSHGITRPVRRLTVAVNSVANGELETEVPETDRMDEVGELARATEVFRQNAIQMARLYEEQQVGNRQMKELTEEREAAAKRERTTAQEKEDSDRLAIAEREAMMRNLGDSFGDVVEAALAGQFSCRVEAAFDDKVLIELADNMNLLMGTVECGLSQTSSTLGRVANGDLTEFMEGEFCGAFGELQSNVNNMIQSLTQLIGDISNSGKTLSGSSVELRETASVLSQQAEQNAAAAEETSTALAELSASICQVNGNISEVSAFAQEASATAAASEEIAAEAANSMSRIADGSKEIARVVDMINDIAFQINLLALNAGVEAARAGDAGLGFSVVASEVRQLSHRASEAAKEIEDVIEQSDNAVATGVSHVASAKDSLEKIAQSVVKISDSIVEVTGAIDEQSSGIREITSSVSQIDNNTQKQAAAFEEVTASSHLLASEAADLARSTGRFQIAAGIPRREVPNAVKVLAHRGVTK